MSSEVFNEDKSELDGFTDTDEKGIDHQVVWQMTEVASDMEYEVWYCVTHDKPYYGGCSGGKGKN
jgi:hypothetical protein